MVHACICRQADRKLNGDLRRKKKHVDRPDRVMLQDFIQIMTTKLLLSWHWRWKYESVGFGTTTYHQLQDSPVTWLKRRLSLRSILPRELGARKVGFIVPIWSQNWRELQLGKNITTPTSGFRGVMERRERPRPLKCHYHYLSLASQEHQGDRCGQSQGRKTGN